MNLQTSPRKTIGRLVLLAAGIASTLLAGCGSGVLSDSVASSLALEGSVQGGLQPVVGATVQVYAASTKGAGTAATKLVSAKVSTSATGGFRLPWNFKCINAFDQIYVIATGGNPGGGNNSSLVLMSNLGTCSKLSTSTRIYVNEVTTIASVYTLAKYINPTTFDVASSSSDAPAVAAAYASAGSIANLTTGAAISSKPVYTKLNSLADSLATCVNSTSTSTACKTLFKSATPSGAEVPANTLAAVQSIALNPTNNVVPIYNLAAVQPFQPTLSSPPADWALFGSESSPAVVVAADPVITWATPTPVVYGTTLSAAQLNATASVRGSFVYSPAFGSVPAVGTDTLSVTFTPTDTTLYNTKSASVSLVVNKAASTVSWSTPAAITYGTALSASQLNATSSVPGSFSYSPAAGTTLGAGNRTLTVVFTPTDPVNNTTQTASVNLAVNKATPSITWATPASITSGTAVSSAQLNATAPVVGSFAYSPAAGTVLPAGTGTLSTTFTPADSANYTSASKSVSLQVTQNQQKPPVLTWATPAAITYGTALSATQLNATSSVPGTFTYSPAIGAVPAAGTDTLSVTFTPTDTTTYSTATATVSLVVNKGSSLVTWATPAPITYGTALSSSQLSATASAPGTFVYSPAIGATPPAGTNTLSVTFTPNDTTTYSASTATVNLVVDKATPSISWATPAPISYGTALSTTQLNATSPIVGSFSYSPAAGTTLSTGTQTLSVTFTPTDTNNYIAGTNSVSLQVNGTSSPLTWATPAAITYGTALSATQLNATSTTPGTFAYTPALGTVLGAGTQSLSVTFSPNDTTNYSTQTTTVSLTVNKATPTINWSDPSGVTYGTTLSSTQLNATASVRGSFVYTPPAGSVVTAGTTTLSALFTPTDSANYTSATKTVNLAVSGGTASITWPNPTAITYGTALSSAQLNANSSVSGSFVYSPAIGTVLTAGTQTLQATFTPNDTTNYSTQTVSASLVVNKATPTITWAAPSAITVGTALSTAQLNATASVPGSFVYSPVAGTILPTGTSTLSVTFTPTDATNYATQTGTVNLVVGTATIPPPTTPTISWSTPSAVTYGTGLSSAQLNATSSTAGTFTYSPAAGTILAAGTRTLTVTLTPTDTSLSPVTASVTVVVNKATPAITWATPAAITYGTALSSAQLNATSSTPGTFAYSPASGTVLGTGTATLSVTFNPTDASYSSATATVSLVVNKIVPTITWATPAAIASGTALSSAQLNATASVPGTFVYSPAAGTVLSAGTKTLSVTFTPTDTTNYGTKAATVSLVVNGGAPTITWATPAAITYGTSLSSTQLNATASLPGTFAYTPASGTVLGAGTTTLKVTYTPTDTTYSAQTATVSLVVNKATPTITWSNPASITLGTILSSTQLNATASVPGSFVYSPALGTTPTSGSNTLSVTFTPTDTANYNTATASATLSVTGGTAPSTTNIAVGSTAAQTGVKRLGMNISGQAYFDSSQMLRNLVFRNPGFEGEIWQSILKCASVTATSCTDTNTWAQWTANFVQGASFEFIYGGAAGQTGTITSSSAAVQGSKGVTINFAQPAKTPKVGDFVILRMTVPGNPQAGWWPSTSGGATLTPEYSDLSSSTVGKQALRMTAASSGQSANVTSYFDTYAGRSFLQMNGTYKIAFRAKGVGGSNQVTVSFIRNLASGGNETFFYQTVPVTSSWQDYSFTVSTNENGTQIGNAKLAFDVSGSSILLDDVSLTPATVTSGNPTPFRDEVVSTLKTLNPGVIRYNDGSNTGSTIDSIIAPAFARQRAGATEQATVSEDVALGLHEFLQLCQTVGAEPYYNMPAAMSTTEMKNLIEYLGGDSSTPYGAKRTAMGQAAPWTTVFPTIHLELGNEQWNSGIFAGSAIDDPVAYGQRAATIFAAAKSSSSYNSSSFDLILGSWAVVPWWTQQETANSSNYDSVSVAPYLFNTLNDVSSNEAIFGSMFAQPEQVDSVSSGYMYQQAQAAKAAGTKIAVYEVNLSTLSGSANQAQVNAVVPSLAAGLTVTEHMLLMVRDLGITNQSLWALPGYNNSFTNTSGGSESTPLFGSVIDMGGQTNLRRPTFLAEQLANTAILPTMLTTTLSGANPTWAQALSTNDDIKLSAAHEIQTFAFSDGGTNRSIIVFNLNRATARSVTFSGANIPTGTVSLGQLTSANLTDNNETTANVKITNSTLSNFQAGTPYSLPPFSMTVFNWKQ